MSFSKKKIKSYCNRKYHTKDQITKYKRKVHQWIDDDKSAYIRKDLNYSFIHCNNLGVIKADEYNS